MQITVKTTVTLIVLSGIIASAFISYIVSSRQAESAVNKLAVEFETRYNQKLYEKRLDAYPSLSKALNDLGRDLRQVDLTYSRLKSSLEEIDRWDGSYAILLNTSAAANILELQNILDGYSIFDPDYVPNAQVDRESREAIFNAALRLEKQLKKDIGIYDTEGYYDLPLQTLYPPGWKYLDRE